MGGWGNGGGSTRPAAPLPGPLTATVILPRIRSGMGPCTRFLSFSAHVPMSSMAMKTSVCRRSTGRLGCGCTPQLPPTPRGLRPGRRRPAEPRGTGEHPRLPASAHVGDKRAEALHDVGAVVALEHHVQVHEDPLVLLLVSRAPHLLHKDQGSLSPQLGRSGGRFPGRGSRGAGLTLTAMTWPVFRKRIFHTWPQVPLPISPRFSRSLISAW